MLVPNFNALSVAEQQYELDLAEIAKTQEGYTHLLRQAVHENNMPKAEYALAHDAVAYEPLRSAIREGRLEMVKLLIERPDADPATPEFWSGHGSGPQPMTRPLELAFTEMWWARGVQEESVDAVKSADTFSWRADRSPEALQARQDIFTHVLRHPKVELKYNWDGVLIHSPKAAREFLVDVMLAEKSARAATAGAALEARVPVHT